MELEISNALGVVGEVAIGLAGFAGLIVTVRNRGFSSWPKTDVVRLQFMLIIACSTFFAALLPYLVNSVLPEKEHTWKFAGILLGTGLLMMFVFHLSFTWSIRHLMVKFWWFLYMFGNSTSALFVFAASLDYINVPNTSGFLTGLLWMLFFSTTLFVRLILTPPEAAEDNFKECVKGQSQ